MKKLSSKTSAEVVPVSFNFSKLTPGPSAITVDSVDVSVYSGTDTAVGAMKFGVPTIVGTTVIQLVQNGVHGVQYMVKAIVSYNLEKYEMASLLPVNNNPKDLS